MVPSAELADLLSGQGRGRRLVLDVGESGVRAVLGLFVQLKDAEDTDGSWNGGDVVAIVSAWFARLGIDPDRPVEQLDGRGVPAVPARRGGHSRPAEEAVREADDVAPDVLEVADGYAVVDLDRVAELVRAEGVECVIDTPGGGVAVLQAGAPTEEPVWAFPWAVQAAPGRFAWDGPSLASTRDLRVGPDTADRDAAVLVRELGAVTAEQIADLVVTQT